MEDRTKRLWGQNIDVVRGGLKEEQVVAFVGELMAKYRALADRQDHILSLGALSEKAALEADKLAAEIKARAKEEVSVEVSTILAQANQTAQEIIANGKKRAQETTRSEADFILDAANRKAQAIETEAKQRAQLFLMKARSVIENDLKGQFVDIYEQLLSALRDLLSENHEIESSWKGKVVELWKREPLELGGYEALTTFLATEITSAGKTADIRSKDRIEVSKEELTAKEEEVFFEVSSAKEDIIPDISPLQEAVSEAPSAAAEAEEVTPVSRQEKATSVPAESKERAKSQPVYEGNYDGEVDISLVPPVELTVMAKIYAALQQKPEIKILRTIGSYDKGNTITVFLEKPLPLVSILAEIPDVEASMETTKKQGIPGVEGRKSTISLKTRS